MEQIYNDTAYQRYIPYIESEKWTAAHDSLLQYYAQEADYIFETDSTEDIINLQTPQGIFAFVTKSLSKSLKGDLKAGNVELLMNVESAREYYDYQTRNYVGKTQEDPMVFDHCNNWEWEKNAVAMLETKGRKHKTIVFAKDVTKTIPYKGNNTTNKRLLKPIFFKGTVQRPFIKVLNLDKKNGILYVPLEHYRMEVTVKCYRTGVKFFTSRDNFYRYLEQLEGIKIKNLKAEKKSPVSEKRGVDPSISYISPSHLTSGTYDYQNNTTAKNRIIIHGSNFGTTKGFLSFINANKSNGFLISPFPYDIPASHILEWHDDKIVANIPNKYITFDPIEEMNIGVTPGTGNFVVRTASGGIDEDFIYIDYATLAENTETYPGYKNRYTLPIK
ncbi:MAG: hypothetical protein IPL35_06335 [Sphingobacteriales bacterium]|nr:hypothetical protein [Sphingobacteriales bacterium]